MTTRTTCAPSASSRATTSWPACSAPATSTCARSRHAFPDEQIVVQGNQITVEGPDAEPVVRLFEELILLVQAGQRLDVVHPGPHHRHGARRRPADRGAALRGGARRRRQDGPAQDGGQKRYVDAISQNIITFGIGPAGTGKSYLAVAQAVQALQSRQVTRIILTRPAVEAGERLGFLPGDLMAKVDPYLRPLYDALYDMLEPEGAQRLLDRGTIEVAPLAFMRGRTLNSSFIILDEAQNTTPEQMKMFLTRIGFGSKCVVTGDVTQIDVPGGRSGLVGLEPVLGGIDGHRLRPPDPPRRRPPPDRGRHRRRLRHGRRAGGITRSDHRRLRRRRAAGRIRSTSPAGPRWPGRCSRRAGVKGETEVSLLFVDEEAIAALNEQFLGKSGPTDVLSFPIEDEPGPTGRSPDFGGTGPGHLGRGRRARPCSATSSSARRWRPATPRSTASASTTSWPCSSCTACCTCSAWTTRTTPRPNGWRRSSGSCCTASTGQPGGVSVRVHPLLATSGFQAADAILIVVIVVLLAASGVLALAETSLVRMSRIKAKSLVDEKRRGARQLAQPGREPGQLPQPDPAAGADLPAGLGHPRRRRGRAPLRRPGRAARHRLRGRRDLRVRRGGAEDLGRAAPRAGRAAQRAARDHAAPLPARSGSSPPCSSAWPT